MKSATTNSNSILTQIQVFDPATQTLSGYLKENRASENVVEYCSNFVEMIKVTAKTIEILPNQDDLTLQNLYSTIITNCAKFEKNVLADNKLSDQDKITILGVTTYASEISKDVSLASVALLNNNSDSLNKINFRGWFSDLINTIIDAIITFIVVAAAVIAAAILVYLTAGLIGLTSAAWATGTLSAFLASDTIIGAIVGSAGAAVGTFNLLCAVKPVLDIVKCFGN